MSSLLDTKRKAFIKDCTNDSIKQDHLNTRFNLLRNELEKFLQKITDGGDKRDNNRLIKVCQQWMKTVKEPKSFESIQDQIDWLNKITLQYGLV